MSKPSSPLHCIRPDLIPTTLHYALITFDIVTISGRYPDDDNQQHYVQKYIAYADRASWEQEIHRRMTSPVSSDRAFVALEANPAKIDINVSVKVT